MRAPSPAQTRTPSSGASPASAVYGSRNAFGAYVGGLVQALNTAKLTESFADPERRLVGKASGFQALVDSIHCYPFATVIEKRRAPIAELVAPKHGTDWEPFLR